MSLTLYGAILSPFVRKVRLLLAEKGLDYQLENVMPGEPAAWFRELSPLGRIPALKDGELHLADSSVIAQYLEEKYPERPRLYGQTAEERARVRWLEKYADYELAPLTTFTVFFNRVLLPLRGKSSDEVRVQQVLEQQLPSHFDYLEHQLGGASHLVGGRLSLADLAVASQLINLDYAAGFDASRWPALAALLDNVRQLPSAQSVLASEQQLLAKVRSTAK